MNIKKREQRKLIIGGVVVLFLLGAVAVLASQLGVFKGYIGSKASICSNNGGYCPGGPCPDGWSFGSDDCYVGISCAQRAIDGCASHQGSGGTGGGGNNNSNTCERGGVTASACYDVAVDGRCMNFNGQCQKTGTNSAGFATCGCKADGSAPPPVAVTRTPTPTMGCMNNSTKCDNNVSYLCQNNGWVRDGKGCSGSTTPPKPTPTPTVTSRGSACVASGGTCRWSCDKSVEKVGGNDDCSVRDLTPTCCVKK